MAKCLVTVVEALDSRLPTTLEFLLCKGAAGGGGGTRPCLNLTSWTQCGGNKPVSPLNVPSNNPQSVAPVTERNKKI